MKQIPQRTPYLTAVSHDAARDFNLEPLVDAGNMVQFRFRLSSRATTIEVRWLLRPFLVSILSR